MDSKLCDPLDKRYRTPAEALKHCLPALAADKTRLLKMRDTLIEVMGSPKDFLRQQWFQLSSFALAFEPDLVIELGRGYGNSTCALTWAANASPGTCRVESFCVADCWRTQSFDVLKPVVGGEFFSILHAHEQDIMTVDFADVVRDARRVFVFWDAHGWDVANYLVANLVPLLAKHNSIIAVHDMADLDFHEGGLKYNNSNYWTPFCTAEPKIVLGNVGMQYEEGVVLMDFATRNGLKFQSAESSYFTELSEADFSSLQSSLGPENVSRYGHWFYLRLSQEFDGLTFPEPIEPRLLETPNETADTPAVDQHQPPPLHVRLRRKIRHWCSTRTKLF